MMFIVPARRSIAGIGSTCVAYDEAGACTAWASDSGTDNTGSGVSITQTPGYWGSIDSTGTTLPTGSTPVDISKIIGSLGTAAVAAVKTFNATQQPGLIPGTQLVYNPATGQVINQAGTTIGAAGTAAAQVASAISPTMIAVMGIAAIGVVALLMGGRR